MTTATVTQPDVKYGTCDRCAAVCQPLHSEGDLWVCCAYPFTQPTEFPPRPVTSLTPAVYRYRVNGCTHRELRIGQLTITEPRLEVRHYEVAAWHSELELVPGTYDLWMNLTAFSRPYVHARIAATEVSRHLPTLLAGVPIGAGGTSDTRGPEGADTWTWRRDEYIAVPLFMCGGYAHEHTFALPGGDLVDLVPGTRLTSEVVSLPVTGKPYLSGRLHAVDPEAS